MVLGEKRADRVVSRQPFPLLTRRSLSEIANASTVVVPHIPFPPNL